MDLISEFKRDESKDYLNVLKALNEIPFPVGKKLLVDFLKGDLDNESINKNNLFELHNFEILSFLTKFNIEEMIEDLTAKKMISLSSVNFNKFIKVLGITIKGQEELANPTLNSKKVNSKYEEIKTEISDSEFIAFKELHDFLEKFNPEQKKAIISKKEKILCIAGAGSGKTTVLTKRIEFLNKYERVHKNKILAITFTRKAKEEMQNRLKKLNIDIKIETFNSFCEKILLKNSRKIYGQRMKIASYQDKIFALSIALTNLNLTIQDILEKYFSGGQRKNKTTAQLQNIFLNDCFSVLDYFKSNKKDFSNFSKDLTGKDASNAKIIYDIVEFLDSHLKIQGLRTYSDQINDAVNFLKNNPDLIPEFEHVLVDEFQDVNASQVELLDLLNSKNLFCVGDPRQSIFGWRGSDISYILDFHKKYNSAEIINLKENYRSVKPIVDLMNKSIKDMKMPNLNSNLEGDNLLKLYHFKDEDKEYEFISRKLLIEETPREEIFILARTNRQLKNLSRILTQNKIPHVLRTEENPNVEVKPGEVTLSSIHSIKGLESELVFVIGCSNLNFPCRVTEHPIMEIVKMYEYDREEEERRLFYVAISRAKNKLYLTYSGKNHTYFINEEMQNDLEIMKF